jgi:aspartate/methionine/tyrosine aminotransferase
MDTREKILNRSRKLLNENWELLKNWFDSQDGLFEYIPPQAGAIVFPRYTFNYNSTQLIDSLRENKSVLLVPGDHFEMDGYIRFGYGEKADCLRPALQRVAEGLNEWKK